MKASQKKKVKKGKNTMKKYELQEKIKILSEISESIYRASEKIGCDALEYNISQSAENILLEQLKQASKKIDKAESMLQNVFDYLKWLEK